MQNTENILKQYFGYSSFRPGQREVVDTLLAGRDVLAIMPTGAGKSLCYQVPALALQGTALVISPLIALMKDQVSALNQAGVKAAFINSSLNARDFTAVMNEAKEGSFKILYVAPERLFTSNFQEFVHQVPLSLVAIDEAHCVSQWGHDFRSSYRAIKTFVNQLPVRPPVGAFTATATIQVEADISDLLQLRDPFLLKTGFDRKNLYFSVKKPRDKKNVLCTFLEERKEASGIVYCSKRKTVEDICELLVRKGFSATRYHAGLSDEERKQNQEDFVYDRTRIMVATNAFGMGIDKSNVSFVVHLNMPKNIESYYQEAGRAGRDGEPATCLLLYGEDDVVTNKYFISLNESERADLTWEERNTIKKRDYQLLEKMTQYCTTASCLRGYILTYFGEEPPAYCGHCSNCDTKFEEVDITVEAQKIISCVMRLDQRDKAFGKALIIKVLRGSSEKKVLEKGLETLSTYGIMEDVEAPRIKSIIEFLLEKDLLVQTSSEYPVLRVNKNSHEIIRGERKVSMQLPAEMKVTKIPRVVGSVESEHAKDTLYDRLVALRHQIADEESVPAYIVFTNAALKDMCRKLPQSKEALLEVSGVGRKKLDLYGALFLQEIADYCVEHNKEKDV